MAYCGRAGACRSQFLGTNRLLLPNHQRIILAVGEGTGPSAALNSRLMLPPAGSLNPPR